VAGPITYVIVPNFVAIGRTVAEILQSIVFNGDCPSPWIGPVLGTTMLGVNMQNLVEINAILSIICKFYYFARLS